MPNPDRFSLSRLLFFFGMVLSLTVLGLSLYAVIIVLITGQIDVVLTWAYWIELGLWYILGLSTALFADVFLAFRQRKTLLGKPLPLFLILTAAAGVVVFVQFFLLEASVLFKLLASAMGDPGNSFLGAATSFMCAVITLPVLFWVYNRVLWAKAAKHFQIDADDNA